MGRTKGLYQAECEVGSFVRIADREDLERFLSNWKLHHPLDPSQLDYAGIRANVNRVSFYHGGDELYELRDIPGIWHELLLTSDEYIN
jgi:hypothetical protein